MNKRKPDDIDPNIQSPPPPPRSDPMCAKCHTSKKVRMVRTVAGEWIPHRHADSCIGKCVVDGCKHWSHGHTIPRNRKKKKTATQSEIDAAVVAGFKPNMDEDLKQMWEDELKAAGLEGTTIPGPGALDKVVNVCKKYAMAKVQKLSPTVDLSDASVNSVVRALEANPSPSPSATATATATPSTTSPTPAPKYQCTNCSWMHKNPFMNGSRCSMCDLGVCVLARAGAAWSPAIYAAAMDVVEQKKIKATSTSTSTSTTTSTITSTSTSTSTSSSTNTSTSTSAPVSASKHDDMTLEMDWNDVLFDDDDEPVLLPISTPKPTSTTVGTLARKIMKDAYTQTAHNMVFKPLNMKPNGGTIAFACKKLAAFSIQTNKENNPNAANTCQ